MRLHICRRRCTDAYVLQAALAKSLVALSAYCVALHRVVALHGAGSRHGVWQYLEPDYGKTLTCSLAQLSRAGCFGTTTATSTDS
jgi:hypothetical protein